MDFLKSALVNCYVIGGLIMTLLMKFGLLLFIWLFPLFIMIKLDIFPPSGLGFLFICLWGVIVFDGAFEKGPEYRVEDSSFETQIFDKEVNIRRNKSPIR